MNRKFWLLGGHVFSASNVGQTACIDSTGEIVPTYSPKAIYRLGTIVLTAGSLAVVDIVDQFVIDACDGLVEAPGEQVIIANRIIKAQAGAALAPNHFTIKVSLSAAVVLARRDNNGSLLCTTCGEPYPYASPLPDGSFVCTPCKVVM